MFDELRREVRNARLTAGVSQASVAGATGRSRQWVSDVERGIVRDLTLRQAARLAAAVGLDLGVRVYPGARRLKDVAQVRILERFLEQLRPMWQVSLEVPIMSDPRDRRAFDAVLRRRGTVVAVEAFSRLRDLQAQSRAAHLKVEAAGSTRVQRLIVVLGRTRSNRHALADAGPVARDAFPVSTRAAMAALRAGQAPPADAIVFI
jgi:transcriptional regulator with XRE-family HTH domain